MSYEIVWSEREVYRRFWGRLDADEYAKAQDSVYGDIRFDGLRFSIIDFSEVTEFVVTREQADLLAAVTRGAFQSNPNIRGAFVTRIDWVVRLLTSTFEDAAYPLAVFATLEEADAWVHQ